MVDGGEVLSFLWFFVPKIRDLTLEEMDEAFGDREGLAVCRPTAPERHFGLYWSQYTVLHNDRFHRSNGTGV